MVATPWLVPKWPAPGRVKSCVTTRAACSGKASQAPYDGFNLALHVGDDAASVQHNRQQLADSLGLKPQSFKWLNQVHGATVLRADDVAEPDAADASFTRSAHQVCVVMTADCLPVLLCDTTGTTVAAVHCGWRSLAGGILANTLAQFENPENVIAWLGPAIGSSHFEVGQDVYDAFVGKDEGLVEAFCVKAGSEPKWYADLYRIATFMLKAEGVRRCYGGDFCTYSDKSRFYSFRRDGARSGRMASCIWLGGEG